MIEQWKDIPNYEGLYEASNLGRIRTKEGKTTYNALYSKRVWKQRILKPKFQKRKSGKNSDARVCLWKDCKCKDYLVSRLIAITWCDGYKDGLTVNHIDGNSLNNNCNNLEWITLKDNIAYGFNNGQYNCRKKCELIDENGKRYAFQSLKQASMFLGRNKHYITVAKRRGQVISSSDNVRYKLLL